jgi:hypothetical protein
MHVNMFVGIVIIVACFSSPVAVVYLMSKFMDWQDRRNKTIGEVKVSPQFIKRLKDNQRKA